MARHPNRTTAFDVARLARTPGVQSTFIFKPSTLTVRIRNAAQKMVRERVLRGRWESKSRQVAKTVLDTLGISYVDVLGVQHIITVPGGLPADVRKDLRALCHADMAGYLLIRPHSDEMRLKWVHYANLENQAAINNVYPHLRLYLEFRDVAFARKAADRMARHSLSLTGLSDSQRAAQAADAFNDPDYSLRVSP